MKYWIQECSWGIHCRWFRSWRCKMKLTRRNSSSTRLWRTQWIHKLINCKLEIIILKLYSRHNNKLWAICKIINKQNNSFRILSCNSKKIKLNNSKCQQISPIMNSFIKYFWTKIPYLIKNLTFSKYKKFKNCLFYNKIIFNQQLWINLI